MNFKHPIIAQCLKTFSKWNEIMIKLDPVGSTVGYEMMKLCTGSV